MFPAIIPNKGCVNYYVDFTGGNDSNSGLTPSAAWKTITKVNSFSFNPGNKVLFKRGETWTGICIVPQSGVTYADYGTGALPIIDGNNTVNCMKDTGGVTSYVTIRNIKFTKGLDFGIQFSNGGNNIIVENVTASACGNDNINFMGCSNVQILNCTSYDAYDRLSDGSIITCVELADGCHDVLINGLTAYNSPGAGISIHSHTATTMPYNIEVKFSTIYGTGMGSGGICIKKDNAAVETNCNIYIHHCTIRDCTTSSAYGINIRYGSTGGWLKGVLFDNCVVYDINGNCLFADNTAKFTRCVFAGNSRAKVWASKDMVFWNCTFFNPTTWPFECLDANDGLEMKNCIFRATADTQAVKIAATTNVVMDYNLYFTDSVPLLTSTLWVWGASYYDWGDWKTTSGQDAHSPTPSNPLFTNPTSHDWTLQGASPAINTGVNVGLTYSGVAPDCGAYEYV